MSSPLVDAFMNLEAAALSGSAIATLLDVHDSLDDPEGRASDIKFLNKKLDQIQELVDKGRQLLAVKHAQLCSQGVSNVSLCSDS
jgi:hypothetical protein